MNILDFLGLGLRNPASVSAQSNAQLIISFVRNGIILLFLIVVIAAIVYAAMSGLKFIQSQGASEKVEEAQEAIKYTLIGVAVAFVGVIGVVIISAIFSPNTGGELSLRCFLGDTDICNISVVNVGEVCPDGLVGNSSSSGTSEYNLTLCKDGNGNARDVCVPKKDNNDRNISINNLCVKLGLEPRDT